MNKILYSSQEIERLLVSAVSHSILVKKYHHILQAALGIVKDLENSNELEEFDYHWNRLYNWGDIDHRLWIQTY